MSVVDNNMTSYNHDNVQCIDGRWTRICSKCGRKTIHSNRNSACGCNRYSRLCWSCLPKGHHKSKRKPGPPVPPVDMSLAPAPQPKREEPVFEENGQWYRQCQQCLRYIPCKTRYLARQYDRQSSCCMWCRVWNKKYIKPIPPTLPRMTPEAYHLRAVAIIDKISEKIRNESYRNSYIK